MAANTLPIFAATLDMAAVTFVNADGTTAKDLFDLTGGSTAGEKVLDIVVTSDDTSAVVIELYVHNGTTAYLVGAVSVPTLSGTDGSTAAVSLLDETLMAGLLDADGQFILADGWKLQVAPQAAVTSGKTVTIVAQGGKY